MAQRNCSPLKSLLTVVLECQLCSLDDLAGVWGWSAGCDREAAGTLPEQLAHVIVLFGRIIFDGIKRLLAKRCIYFSVVDFCQSAVHEVVFSDHNKEQWWMRTGLLGAASHLLCGTTEGNRYYCVMVQCVISGV